MSESGTETRSTRWMGKTTEERKEERRVALVDAAIAIAATSGVSAIGVRAICREAGLTERYFYENFAGLDDLVGSAYSAVVDEAYARMRAAIDEARAVGGSLPDASIRSLVHFLIEDAGRSRLFLMEQTASTTIAMQLERKRTLATQLYADLFAVIDEDSELDEFDLRLNALALIGSQTRLMLQWAEGTTGVTEERFVRHMLNVYHAVAAVRSS